MRLHVVNLTTLIAGEGGGRGVCPSCRRVLLIPSFGGMLTISTNEMVLATQGHQLHCL